MAVLLFALIVMIIIAFKTIHIVKNGEVLIIERLGRFHKVAEAGLEITVPFIDKVRRKVKLGDQTNMVKVPDVITKDRKKVDISVSIIYEIVDPARSVYEIDNLKSGLEYIIITTLHGEISTLNYNDIFLQRENLLASLKEQLSVSEESWGFQTVDISIVDVNLQIK